MLISDPEPEHSTADLYQLYLKEQKKVAHLQNELEITSSQSQTYARELSNIYQHSKRKRKQLADTNKQLVKYASDLRITFSSLKAAHNELQEAYRDTIFRLVLASEFKDKDTGNHISRISRYSALLALKLKLDVSDSTNISLAAPMHDVGKIGIPDHIMLKNGILSETEFSIIKTHTTIGAAILDNSKSAILQMAHTIALCHHEHWNGNGYPNGLKSNSIPLVARIVALADTFDALTTSRPYKSPYPMDVTCKIIRRERERQFDPCVVDVFLDNIDEFAAIKNETDNKYSENLQFFLSERDQVSL
ncbi:MAG TPA: HD domain-containing phosphohydrolase [Chitinispirillaceae bacterium]|nr:HD domain-containing phosphohydrolase [Chitinispirillaceae bacterium]